MKLLLSLIILTLLGIISACSNIPDHGNAVIFDTGPDLVDIFETDDTVTLTRSTVSWETYAYQLTKFDTILTGSYDGKTKVQKTFDTWVLENEYLKVTLLPEFGGRILSIIYKPTGHEELYQNPVGVPYQIDTKIFYYDWLMVYGGIFPTFPEPEHGKAWFYPWDFEVIKDTDQEIIVAMSYLDAAENLLAPPQYNLGATGLEVTYIVSLKAGRAAVDATVLIDNPGDETIEYEYWTNTTLAPGSDPGDPKTTSGAEIIAPVEKIKIPDFWQAIAAQEKPTGLIEVYHFEKLRWFENWADMGIAYAFPDMKGFNFWGVINHDNQEGIFRIADNTITPGMKIWTWGFPKNESLDPHTTAGEARPYIELWAGLTREFWQRTKLSAQSQVEINETYSPSVGLDNVTHADENFLVNLDLDQPEVVECQIFGVYPNQHVEAFLLLDGIIFHQILLTLNPEHGNAFSAPLPEWSVGSELELLIEDQSGNELFSGTVSFSTDG